MELGKVSLQKQRLLFAIAHEMASLAPQKATEKASSGQRKANETAHDSGSTTATETALEKASSTETWRAA